jgi:hypothetical protein
MVLKPETLSDVGAVMAWAGDPAPTSTETSANNATNTFDIVVFTLASLGFQ